MAQDKTQKLQDNIEALYDVIDIYDSALSALSGMLTATLNEPDISDWQARSIIKCAMATSVYYADNAKKEMEAINE